MARPKKPAEVPIIPPWFKVWTRWLDGIDILTNEQAGQLLKAMVSFSIDGTEPKFNDSPLKMLWSLIANQMKLDRQMYINQVIHNRKAGTISAKNKAEKTRKKLYQKNGVSEAGNTDGTRDSQQVLTSVNEERRKKKEERSKKELSLLLPADHFDMEHDEEYITSQRAVNILKELGEKLTLPKMKMVTRFIKTHDGMTDEEVKSGIKHKLTESDE